MARDSDVPPIQTVKVVGTQTREFWTELQAVVNEAERNGWTIKVLVEGDEARASFDEFLASPDSQFPKDNKQRSFWARLFG